jgi:hypothetical protein
VARFRPDQDQRIKRPVVQTLAMEAPGSSQWMEPIEPELEAATLNLCRAPLWPGRGPAERSFFAGERRAADGLRS